jgi:ADP-ribose pyrophosphatase YjhB (NUDIX family)
MTNSYGTFSWNYCAICGGKLIEADDGQSTRPYCAACHRFYYSNPVPAACCFLTNPDGELLMVQRAIEPRKGMWSLPGGFVELGETTEQAALRELQEETGLVGRGASLMGVSTRPSKMSGGVIVLGYRVDEWEGELKADTDAADLGFFHRERRPPVAFEVHQELLKIYDAVIHGIT